MRQEDEFAVGAHNHDAGQLGLVVFLYVLRDFIQSDGAHITFEQAGYRGVNALQFEHFFLSS